MPASRIILSGQVQGVGFRPFVFRLAHQHGVTGWVKNVTGKVEIHAEAEQDVLDAFCHALNTDAPAIARPVLQSNSPVAAEQLSGFHILPSTTGTPDIHVPPDYFVCADCQTELLNPRDRRYRYPFINCTQCGPRYTLMTALPYDRDNTSMRAFSLCPVCQAEYENPLDRRFHAEPVACPQCGPSLSFTHTEASPRTHLPPPNVEQPLDAAIAVLRQGGVVAVKGIGGYHLLCDAHNDAAVTHLRQRKQRPDKPLAVMFPDLDSLRDSAELSDLEEAALTSPARPIVLLTRKRTCTLSTMLAPGLNEIGCFLPYSPLHVMLLADFAGPLVATSGNLSGEPVLIDNMEAEARLAPVADVFLHHNRPIVRPADDSVVRRIAGRMRPLRLGRGIAPLEVTLPRALPEPVLALGSHMKNTLCLAWDDRAVISPHIGELSAARSQETLMRLAEDLQQLYQVRATRLLTDAHPGYGYQHWARSTGLPITPVWHHAAHASALAGEHPDITDWIIFTWDGVGLGQDHSLWGGETFVGGPGRWQHQAGLRPFHLPGGERAGREPWRSAAALLWECGLSAPFAPALVHAAWQKKLNCPETTAMGRLFDAAAALTGLCQIASFEGQGPMYLESAATNWLGSQTPPPCMPEPLNIHKTNINQAKVDWASLLPMLMDTSLPVGERAWRMHATLASTVCILASTLRDETGIQHVGLTGGVFQNRLLSELIHTQLHALDFKVHLPQQVPMNDAGVSYGQVIQYLYTSHA